MSVNSIINPTTGKIYDDLVPQGGGVPLQKGGLITADAGGTETALAVSPNNGWVLSAQSGQNLGLEWIQPPAGGINFTQEGQLLYAGAGPAFADSLLNIGTAGQVLGIAGGIPAWTDTGGSGLISANPPLLEEADPAPNSKISINFSANIGEIPYGNGTAKVGALTNVPVAGDILGMAGNPPVPTWINAPANVGTIVYRNSVDNVPLQIDPPLTANSTCIITADRTFQTFSPAQIYNESGAGTPVDATGGLTFYTYTPPNDIEVSNIVVKIDITANLLIPTPSNNFANVSVYNGATLVLAGDTDPFGAISGGLVQFNIPSPVATTLVAGQAYTFVFDATTQVSTTIDFTNLNPLGALYVGTIDITGITYLGQPASFTLAPPHKFRTPNNVAGNATATCESYSSQSFVSTSQQNTGIIDWVMVGGQNGGVAFV